MHRPIGPWILVGALALMGLVRPLNHDRNEARAADEETVVKSERGGLMVTIPRHRFEVFCYKTGLRIFPRAIAGAPVTVSKLTGSAAFMLPGAPNPIIYPLKGGAPIRGREPESLDLATDLSWVPARETKVNLTIAGLADSAEDRVSFTVPFELVAPPRQADETAARPSPASLSPSAPRYTYRLGYSGYGYYPTPSPASPVSPAPAPTPYVTIEREVPIERPWSSPIRSDDYNAYTQSLFGG